ncbi:hypothetical protein B0H14DRAFT_2592512 [Mycena olivaceomarginata]|nr:hypothetical protein B0H14DRAFT_2592512 [Mycena olivaceomarginata]
MSQKRGPIHSFEAFRLTRDPQGRWDVTEDPRPTSDFRRPSFHLLYSRRAENQGLQCALKPFHGGSQTGYGIWYKGARICWRILVDYRVPQTKPTIIIIPGSFCKLYSYDVTAELVPHGYPVEGIKRETVGRPRSAPGLYDAAALTSKLTEEGKDVVLVPHSYGGLVACEASKGLSKSVRAKAGKQDGIVRIVFATAVVGKEGKAGIHYRRGRMYGYGPSRMRTGRFLTYLTTKD